MLSSLYSRKRLHDDGFTLIELLIVVIIIGILAAIALPIFLNQQKAAVDASVQSDVRNTVAQLTGAQALKVPTFKPTVSRAHTTLELSDSTDGTKNSTATGADAAPSLVTPEQGDAYTLDGYNPDGGKFQGPGTGLNGKAFTYDGASGKFAAAPAASVANALITVGTKIRASVGGNHAANFLLEGDDVSSGRSAGSSGAPLLSAIGGGVNGLTLNTDRSFYYQLDGLYDASGGELTSLERSADNFKIYVGYDKGQASNSLIARATVNGAAFDQAAADQIATIKFSDNDGNSYTISK